MTLSGLVTFWALMITAYSVVPEYWKFKLKAFVGLIPTVVAFLISSALVSWSMLIGERGLTITMQDREFTIFPMWLQIAAYTVLFLYVLWLVWQLRRSRVTAGNLLRFQQLLSSLATNKQFNLIATVLKDNIQRLGRIYDHKPFWQRVIKVRNNTLDNKIPFPLYSKRTKYQEGVLSVFDQITSDKAVAEFLVSYDVSIPLLLVQVAEGKAYNATDYLHSVLELLISRPGSELYRQIQQHQNFDPDWAGKKDIRNSELLQFLFKDAEMAKKRAIWKPVGDYVLRYLHDRPGAIEDEYNREAGYYNNMHGTERFSDPAFVGLDYFDFMVKEALVQSMEWHMWLYYLRYWTREIVSKLKYDPDEWQKGYWEHPTKYTFLLYYIIHYQLDWFRFALQHNLDIKIEQTELYENSNILKSAAQCLANSLRLICESKELPDSYKRSLITSWWNTYFELEIRKEGNYSEHADFFLKIMVSEIEGDIIQGAFRSSLSLPLLGGIVTGLTHVDEIKEWVDDKTYKGRLAEMKQLVQKHVLPVLSNVPPENRAGILTETLGSEFQLANGNILVSNRFGQWTELCCLP